MAEYDSPIRIKALAGGVIDNNYRLEEFLDEGNFGAVYRATHLIFGVPLREVAIKIAKRAMTNEEAQKAFGGEAKMMAKITDLAPEFAIREHFITVHNASRCTEYDSTNSRIDDSLVGHPYVVMELIKGRSLKRILKPGPLPLTLARAYFEQILVAIAFMHGGVPGMPATFHDEPVAHRDLKPSNVLVIKGETRDILKITDFGLAIDVDSLLGWVDSGGDLAYLAPESFSHNISSPQSDVYMLGLIFYEMLTGRNPFGHVGDYLRGPDDERRKELKRLHFEAREAENFALLDQHFELREQPHLLHVIRTALALDMKAREYTNAIEMLAAWRIPFPQNNAVAQPPDLAPWETVKQLTREAEQCMAVGNFLHGEELLDQALDINRQVPDKMMIGYTYLLKVQVLIQAGNTDEAADVVQDGFQRRQCRSTCLAMVEYFRSQGSPLVAHWEREAQKYPEDWTFRLG